MVAIPRYYADAQVDMPQSGGRLDIHSADALFDTSGVQNAVNQFVDSALKREDKFKQAAEFTKYHERTNAMALDIERLSNEAQQQPDGERENYFKQNVSSIRSRALDGITDIETRAKIEAAYGEVNTKGLIGIQHFERKRIVDRGVAALDEQRASLLKSVDSGMPTNDIRVELWSESVDDAVNKGFITSEVATKYKRGFLSDAEEIAAQNYILKDPSGALKQLQSRTGFTELDPEKRNSLIMKAQHAEDRLRAKAAQGLPEQLENARVQAETTGDFSGYTGLAGRAAYAYGAEKANDVKRDIMLAKATYDTFQKVTQVNPIAAMNEIEKLKPQVGSANYADEWRAYERVTARYGQFMSSFQNDPVSTLRQVKAIKAGDDVLAQQRLMGVPDYAQRWFTNSEAADTVAKLQEKNAMDRVAAVQQLRSQFGDESQFRIAYRDLVRAGLDKGTVLVANMASNPSYQRSLANAMDVGDKKLSEAIREGSASGSSDLTTIKEGVTKALAPYRTSVFGKSPTAYSDSPLNSAKFEHYQGIEQAIGTLAMYYKSQGLSNKAAIEKAAAPFVEKYKYASTFRVPGAYDVDKVNGYANDYYIAEVLPKLNITMFGANDPRAQNANTENEKADYLRNIEKYGSWITNEGEDGIYLTNERGLPVYHRDDAGSIKRVELKFSDIQENYHNVKNRVHGKYERTRIDNAKERRAVLRENWQGITDTVNGLMQ